MQPLSVSFIVTPFVTGFVGYVTNWLAIKMLFRPHKRRWYSFGWIGVIPRNRSKLASKVGIMVGEKLIGEEEIAKAVKSDNVQSAISDTIEKELENFLKTDHGSISDILEKIGLHEETVIKKLSDILADETTLNSISEALSSITAPMLERLADTELNTLAPEGGLEPVIRKVFTEGKWQPAVINEISNRLNNLVLSGKSFSDLLPDKLNQSTGKVADFLTDKALDILDKLFEDENSRKKVAERLISLKDSMFGGSGFDQLKLGFLNMFLNEDSINDLVQEHLPKLINGIKTDPALKQRISKGIKGKIDEFLKKPLYAHAGKIGFETIYEVRSDYITRIQKYLSSESFAESISKAACMMLEERGATIGSAAKMIGIDLKNEGTASALITRLAGSGVLKNTLPHAIYKILKSIRAANLYDGMPKKSFFAVKAKLTDEINILLEKNVPGMVRAVDLPGIVEKKINTLNLYEVEDILFDFMKDQFKWINRLGFVLGFIFGLVQVAVLIFMQTQ
ncbi:DUF445 family protein [Geovibrio sp. ADMFC3]